MYEHPDRIRVGEYVTIYPRGKKKIWCAEFWRDGEHCRQSLKTTNKKIALQRAIRLEVQLASDTFEKPPPIITLRQASANYLAFLETEHRARRTLVKYRGILNELAGFLESQQVIRLSHFSTTLFDKFRAFRKPGCRRKTLYTESVVVKQFFRWSKSRKLIVDNPIADYKLEKPVQEPKAGPGLTEISRILAASRGAFKVILGVLSFTGMRSGELQRLRKEDLDLAGNWLHVMSRPGAETKTKTSRKIPLHAQLRELLERCPKSPGPWLFSARAADIHPATTGSTRRN
jgi:integrase